MNDLISRQTVINEINERQRKLIYCFGFENDMVKIMDIAKSIVIAMPSAQPERKTGHWILLDECANSGYYCSECSKRVIREGLSKTVRSINYCPNCGADMREVKDE